MNVHYLIDTKGHTDGIVVPTELWQRILDCLVEQLKHLADAYGLVYRQPGTSHVTFRHSDGAKLTVPAHSPIKPVYIKKFLRLLQKGIGD